MWRGLLRAVGQKSVEFATGFPGMRTHGDRLDVEESSGRVCGGDVFEDEAIRGRRAAEGLGGNLFRSLAGNGRLSRKIRRILIAAA